MSTDKRTEAVRGWLDKHGFPMEFRVANAFAAAGFAVTPSHYVETEGAASPREVDVLAVHSRGSDLLPRKDFRLYVEAKWSRDVPWLVFVSPHAALPRRAALRATPNNGIGQALLWLLEERPELSSMAPFDAPKRPGYGGRVMTKDNKDPFYRAMQAIVDITMHGVGVRDEVFGPPTTVDATFGFPVIVVDGPLYEVSLDESTRELNLQEVSRTRVQWRGIDAQRPTQVDIVTVENLSAFATDWMSAFNAATDYMSHSHYQVADAIRKQSLEPLRFLLHGRKLSPPTSLPPVIRWLSSLPGAIP